MHTTGRRSINASSHSCNCNLAKPGSVEDDEECEKSHGRMIGSQTRAWGGMPHKLTNYRRSSNREGNACDSHTQLCGQASDEIKVMLSDGGCINVEDV